MSANWPRRPHWLALSSALALCAGTAWAQDAATPAAAATANPAENDFTFAVAQPFAPHIYGANQRAREAAERRDSSQPDYAAQRQSSSANKDPLEPLNRKIFAFNDSLDRTIAKPAAQAYEAVTPAPIRGYVGNFFNNLEDAWSTVNHALQLRPKAFVESAFRLSVNTVLGFGGFVNLADDMGLERDKQDFGKTLGRWGVGSGPYLVLPVFGASTLRDGLGKGVDGHYSLISNGVDHIPSRNSLYAADLLNTRSQLLSLSNVLEEAALDKYAFTRNAYLQLRQSQINALRGVADTGGSSDEDERWWEDEDAANDTESSNEAAQP